MGWPKVKRRPVERVNIEQEAHAKLSALRDRLGMSWPKFFECLARGLTDDLKLDPSSTFGLTVLSGTNSEDAVNMPSTCRQHAVNMPSSSIGPTIARVGAEKKTTEQSEISAEGRIVDQNSIQIDKREKKRSEGGAESAVCSCPFADLYTLWDFACGIWEGEERARCAALAEASGTDVPIAFLEPAFRTAELDALIKMRWRQVPSVEEWQRRFSNLLDAHWVVRSQGWNELEDILIDRPKSRHGSIFNGLRKHKHYAPEVEASHSKRASRQSPPAALEELERIRRTADHSERYRGEAQIERARELLCALDEETRESVRDALEWAFRMTHEEFMQSPVSSGRRKV